MSYEHIVEPSYIIFKEDSKVLARNGKTGVIDYSGTIASTVIQSAIDALTNGGKIFIKAGIYTITASIITKSNIWLTGEGDATTLWLNNGVNDDIIKTDPTLTSAESLIRITDMKLDGNRENNPIAGNGLKLFCERSWLERLTINNMKEYAMKFTGYGTSRSKLVNIVDVLVERSLAIDFENATDCFVTGLVVRTYFASGLPSEPLVLIRSGGGYRFVACHFINSNQYGMLIRGGSSNNLFIDTYWDSNKQHGLVIDGSDGAVVGVNIVGCFFLKNGLEATNTYDHIFLDSSVHSVQNVNIVGSLFRHASYTRNVVGGIGNYNYNIQLIGNQLRDGFLNKAVDFVTSPTYPSYFIHNAGFVTENSGTITLASGESFPHNCDAIPTWVHLEAINSTIPTSFASSISASSITVYHDQPGSIDIAWSCGI